MIRCLENSFYWMVLKCNDKKIARILYIFLRITENTWFSFFITWEQRKFSELYRKVSEKNDLTYGKKDIISVANMHFKEESYITDSEYLRTYNVFLLGDIAFEGNKSKDFKHGRFVENTIGNGIVSHVFDVFRPIMDKYDLLFWKYAINNERLMGQILVRSTKASTMMTNLVAADFLNEYFLVPEDGEQKAIGKTLNAIDNLITLHQRKEKMRFLQMFCKFKRVKKAFVWEQRKLSDEVQITMGQSPDGTTYRETPSKYILVQGNADLKDGWVYPRIWTTQKTKTADAGALIMSVRAPAGSMGKTAYNVVLGRGVAAIKGNEFIFQTLVKMDSDGYWKKLAAGSTFESINSDTISNAVISLPRQDDEQSKIGEWFNLLDNLITLHQCKGNKYGYNKMIPLNFYQSIKMANAWEQRKLGELGKAQSGIGFPDKEQGGKKGIPFFKVSDMNNLGNELEMHLANNYVSLEQIKKNGWAPIEETSVIFAKVGAAIMLNRKRLVRYPFLLDNNTMAYKFNDAWEIDFGRTLFERIDLTSLVQVGALPSYNAGDVENMEVAIPQKAEQAKLGALFASLDNLITLHQCKQHGKLGGVVDRFFSHSKVQKTNTWEQRKLGVVAYRVNEMSAIEGLPRVEYEDIEAGQGTLNKNLKEKVSNKKGILFQHSDILYGKLRPYLKNWLFADFLGIAVGDFWVLRSNSVAHSFIYRLLQTPAFDYVANQSSGSKMPRADWKLVSNTEFSFPVSTEEQEKIGLLFLKLDNLITLHQRGENT